MSWRWTLLLVMCLSPVAARAMEPVDLALVLVTDVSRSIDDQEYRLEKEGTATALTSPAVLAAIRGGALGRIAIAYEEFAGPYEVRMVLGFTIIEDKASAHSQNSRHKAKSSISAGIDLAMKALNQSGLEATRRVIDVCGDGTNNSGREITEARDDALRQGVVINGLTIINDHPVSYTFAHVAPPGGLTNWYRENVVGGPGGFVLEVHDFHSFGEAMTRKLISEIAALRAQPGPG